MRSVRGLHLFLIRHAGVIREGRHNVTLTTKQQAFVEAYLANGFNGTRAAETAGYKGNYFTLAAVAYENLRKPQIAELVRQRLNEHAMSAAEALARLADHARGDMRDFVGVEYTDLKDHPTAGIIKKLKRKVETDQHGGVTEYTEVELYDAQAAVLAILKEHHLAAGEATERTDVRLTKVPPLPDDQLDNIFGS